jgi:hypothetical protein
MTVFPTTPAMSCDQRFDAAAHDVICLVKRHTYELAFAIPPSAHGLRGGAQPCLHVRVKQTCVGGGFALNLEDVECFYEDLLQMMEYLQNERQRIELSESIA